MSKKSKEITAEIAEIIDEQHLEKAVSDRNKQLLDLAGIEKIYGDGLPYDREGIVSQCKVICKNITDNFIALGRRLIWMKARETDKTFESIIQDLGFGERTARYLMGIARKMLEDPEFAKHYKGVPYTKLRLLISAPIEDIDKFVEQLPTEKVDRLTVNELKTELDRIKKLNTQHLETIYYKDQTICELKQRRDYIDEALLEDWDNKFNQIAELMGMAAVDRELIEDRSPDVRAGLLNFFSNIWQLANAHLENAKKSLTVAEATEILSKPPKAILRDSFFTNPDIDRTKQAV